MYIILFFSCLLCPWAQGQGLLSTDTLLADTTVVAWVNGLPVEAKWLRDEMHYDKGKIMGRYITMFGRETVYQKDFWEGEYTKDGLELIPFDELKAATLQRLCTLKFEHYLLKENKLLKDSRYTSFLTRMEWVNKERKATKQKGGIIYGPVEYSPKTYYSYYYSNKILELKKKIAKKTRLPKEKELKEMYWKDREQFNLPEVRTSVLLVVAEIEKVMDELKKHDLENRAWEDVAQAVNETFGKEVCRYLEEEYGAANAKLVGSGQSAFKASQYKLGDILDWGGDGNGHARRIRVLEKTDNYMPYVEAKGILLSQYFEQKYQEYYEERLREMKVELTDSYDLIRS